MSLDTVGKMKRLVANFPEKDERSDMLDGGGRSPLSLYNRFGLLQLTMFSGARMFPFSLSSAAFSLYYFLFCFRESIKAENVKFGRPGISPTVTRLKQVHN
jgi:hypothetical protein